jgi:hypothetical protein
MGFERPDQTEKPESRERQLDRKLHELQLRFADRKWRQAVEDGGPPFLDTLDGISTLVSDARADAYLAHADDPDAAEAAWQETAKEVESLHDEGGPGWASKATALLERWTVSASKPLDALEGIGFLKFGLKTGEAGLESRGIGPDDPVLEIHVSEVFRHPETPFTLSSFKEIFGALAKRIAEEQPGVRAIVGQSWLFDHALAKRLGFTVVEDADVPQDSLDVWLQFVDKDGKIDERRVKALFEKGKPPYQSKLGFMPIEEFNRRYLAADEDKKDKGTRKTGNDDHQPSA